MTPSADTHPLTVQAGRLYRSVPLPGRWVQRNRPRICPFGELLPFFPPGGRVLDVGCGSGLLLGLLAENGLLGEGVGFDASEKAIRTAGRMAADLPADLHDRLTFLRLDARAPWPDGEFQIVSLIDVMHHVPPEAQRRVFDTAVAKVSPGGRLIYKDMARRPAWSAWANRLHDLVMAREWIHYCPVESVREWGEAAGLTVQAEGRVRLLWYTREYIVFERGN